MRPSADIIPPACDRLLSWAERDPRRTVPLARRAYARSVGGTPLDRAWAGYTLGYALLCWEQLLEAGALLEQARDAFTALGCSIPALHAQHCLLVTTLHHTGRLDIPGAWSDLASAYTLAGLPLQAARASIHEVWHYNLLGRPRKALALAASIMPLIQQQGRPEDQGRILRIMAAAHSDCGAFAQSLALIEQAMACFMKNGAPIEIARCLMERAWHLQRQEIFAPAREDLLKARAIFERAEMPLRLAFCDKHLGLLSSRLGRYDKALTKTLQARAAFVGLGRLDAAATCDLNLGIIAYYSGLFDLALAAYRRAEAVYSTIGNQRMVLISRRNQAMALRMRGQPLAAHDLLNAITPALEELDEQFELAEIHHAQGQVLLDLRQPEQALRHLQMAEKLFRRLDAAGAVAESVLEQGWLHIAQDDVSVARQCFIDARLALDDRPVHQWRADYGLGKCAEREGQTSAALALYRRASLTVAELRGQLLSAHASSGIFEQARQLHGDALRLAWHCDEPGTVLEFAEQQRALALARQLHSTPFTFTPEQEIDRAARQADLWRVVTLDAPIEVLDAAVSAYIEVLLCARHQQPHPEPPATTDLDFDDLRRQWSTAFPAGWTALIYVPCGEVLLIITCDADDLQMSATPFDDVLHDLVAQACHPRHRKDTYMNLLYLRGREQMPWATLAALGARLIPSHVQERLHPNHRLLIVAEEMLHKLPWAALRLRDAWLVEQAVVQMLPGLWLGRALMSRPLPERDMLLLGLSKFGERASYLPNAHPSLDLVERCWDDRITRLQDELVTRQTLLDLAASGAMRRYGLLHIATHGQFVTNQGLLAHLKLADDVLFYDDITGLGIGGAIVVLVACEGAASEVLPGEEVLSLSRAFLTAGARDVIASIWQIYDATVLALLEPLYLALNAGMDAPTALAMAQRALLTKQESGAPVADLVVLPFIWASLCVIGAGAPIWPSAGGTKPTDVPLSDRDSS